MTLALSLEAINQLWHNEIKSKQNVKVLLGRNQNGANKVTAMCRAGMEERVVREDIEVSYHHHAPDEITEAHHSVCCEVEIETKILEVDQFWVKLEFQSRKNVKH